MTLYLMTFGKPRFIGVLETELALEKAGWTVVSTARGTELALNIGESDPDKVDDCRKRLLGAPTDSQAKGGEPPFQDLSFLRVAGKEDLEARRQHEEEEEQILVSARQMLREHKLPMKLVEVEYLLDAKKLFFYFTAEQRIDFRAYVRDLARAFKTRIELRQIGVRDEAKVVKGLSPCGMPCCCSYWLERFDPICIKMVKEQNLALNPAKISGICGRLMCCMAFEHDTYRELWQNLPNPGTKIKTPGANYILSGVDIRSKAVRVFHPEKGEMVIKVDDFDDFKTCVQEGKTWEKLHSRPDVTETTPIPREEDRDRPDIEIEDSSCPNGGADSTEPTGEATSAGEKPQRKAEANKKEHAGGGDKKRRRRPSRKNRSRSRRTKASSGEPSRNGQVDQEKERKKDAPEKPGKPRKSRRRNQKKRPPGDTRGQ